MTPDRWLLLGFVVLVVLLILLVLSDLGKAVLLKWGELKTQRSLHEDWQDLEADVDELIRAHLHVAQCQVRLAARIETAPKEFVEEILRAADLGYGVERAARRMAEKHGLWRPSALEYGERAYRDPKPESAAQPEPIVVEAPPSMWEGDKLVPRRGS